MKSKYNLLNKIICDERVLKSLPTTIQARIENVHYKWINIPRVKKMQTIVRNVNDNKGTSHNF
jgi:hypothetical protein